MFRRLSSVGGVNVVRKCVSSSSSSSLSTINRPSIPNQSHLVVKHFSVSSVVPKKRRTLSSLDTRILKGQKAFVRVDFNVPMDKKSGKITDDTRIRESLPTIHYLVKNQAKVILVSHLGRPTPENKAKLSLKPIAARLSELLGKNIRVTFVSDCIGEAVSPVKNLQNGEVALLENVRFYEGEEKNDSTFAKQIYDSLGGVDVYVNDAFGTAHRGHVSTHGITKYIKGPHVSGFLMDKELKYLYSSIHQAKKPFISIIGGAKIDTKLKVINSLMERCNKVILGGGMFFPFLAADSLSFGAYSSTGGINLQEMKSIATSLQQKSKEHNVELIIPSDVVVANEFSAKSPTRVTSIQSIQPKEYVIDIGPASLQRAFSILDTANTILWNGPLGVFEFENGGKSTRELAKYLAQLTSSKGITTIVGGGDSVAAVNEAGVSASISHISTGGGAALELLEGTELPGVQVLDVE